MTENQPLEQQPLGSLVNSLLDVNTDDPVRLRRGRLVSLVLLVALAVTVSGLVVTLFSMPSAQDVGRLLLTAFTLSVTYTLNRRSASPLAGLVLSVMSLTLSVIMLSASGPLSTYVISLTLPVLIAGLLGPPGSAFLLATLAGIAYAWLNAQRNPTYLADALRDGAGAETIIVYLNLYVIAALGWLFSRMAGRAIREWHAEVAGLEAQQEALQTALQRQTLNLRATTSVAREVVRFRDENTMLRDTVKLVQQYFRYDDVQIYLMDETRKAAVLRATTSPAGRELMKRQHSLPVGALSVVGLAIERREAVVGEDKPGPDFVLQKVERSPDVHSEVGVPLIVGGDAIGVLHLHSFKSGAFSSADLPVLQSLADQLAVAIVNARLYEETQRNLLALSELSREATQRGWRTYLFGKSEADRVFRHGAVDEQRWISRQEAVVKDVVDTGEMVLEQRGGISYLAVPLSLRNEVIGVIGVETDGVRHWTQDDVTIMQSVAERVTLAVENARLFEQAHRTAQREQLINTIASRLQRAPSLQILLESVAAELSEALGTDEVYAEFTLLDLKGANGNSVPGGNKIAAEEHVSNGETNDVMALSEGGEGEITNMPSPNGDHTLKTEDVEPQDEAESRSES